MESVFKIAALCVCAVLTSLIIKEKNPSGAFLVTLTTFIVCSVYIIPRIKTVIDELFSLLNGFSPGGKLFEPLIKTLCITLVCKISAELCAEKGERALSSLIELSGVTLGTLVSFPLIKAVIKMLGDV